MRIDGGFTTAVRQFLAKKDRGLPQIIRYAHGELRAREWPLIDRGSKYVLAGHLTPLPGGGYSPQPLLGTRAS
jgi:hypothetical protein